MGVPFGDLGIPFGDWGIVFGDLGVLFGDPIPGFGDPIQEGKGAGQERAGQTHLMSNQSGSSRFEAPEGGVPFGNSLWLLRAGAREEQPVLGSGSQPQAGSAAAHSSARAIAESRIQNLTLRVSAKKLLVGETLRLECKAETFTNGRIEFTWSCPRGSVSAATAAPPSQNSQGCQNLIPAHSEIIHR